MTLNRLLQLHEEIRIIYTVYDPKYQAILETGDGLREVMRAGGNTIEEALQKLEEKTKHLTLDDVRGRRKHV